MKHDDNEAQDEEEDGVNQNDKDHLLTRLNQNIQLPTFRLLMVVSHDEKDTLGDDRSPDP